MHYAVHDVIGNIGLVLLLGTYLLLQLGRISSGQLRYSISNARASLLIGISLLFKFNISAFLVEDFLFVFSLYGIFKYFSPRSIVRSVAAKEQKNKN
ncbi:hypothetical protein [Desulfovibrio sp. ZJ369]|uniref:CBU_0592 family membrane protein n=1 Tax=Desulfovibrio sp. ZJ369 TaxID=2709793 RepID=UPI001F14FE62|nr:hypothetical protein [Desulfovibrio sp. ZJ369]